MWNNLTKYNFFDFVIHWVIYLNSIFIITSSLLKSFGFLWLLVSRNLFYNHRDNYGTMTRRQPHSTNIECTLSNYFDPKVSWSLAEGGSEKSADWISGIWIGNSSDSESTHFLTMSFLKRSKMQWVIDKENVRITLTWAFKKRLDLYWKSWLLLLSLVISTL